MTSHPSRSLTLVCYRMSIKKKKKRPIISARRRFVMAVPVPRGARTCTPLATLEALNVFALQNVPLGVTPPSPVCQPDSVMYLLCPRCLCIWYISRGLYNHLTRAEETAQAMSAPDVFSWFHPYHTPCNVPFRQFPLSPVEVQSLVEDRPL